MSERTLYSYVNNGIFSARNIDMPRTVRMRPRKSKTRPLKVDKSCRINRTFKDYKDYMSNHSDLPAQQIDSVIGIGWSCIAYYTLCKTGTTTCIFKRV